MADDNYDGQLEGYSVPTLRPEDSEYLESLRLLRAPKRGLMDKLHKTAWEITDRASLERFKLFPSKALLKQEFITIPCMIVSFDTLYYLQFDIIAANRLWTAWLKRRKRELKSDPDFEPDPYDDNEVTNDKPVRAFLDLIVTYIELQPECDWLVFVEACGVKEKPLEAWLKESELPGFDQADEYPFHVRQSWVHQFVCSKFQKLERIRNKSLERWSILKCAGKLG